MISLYRPLWTDKPFAKRRRAAYGGTAGQEDLPWFYGCSRGVKNSRGASAITVQVLAYQ